MPMAPNGFGQPKKPTAKGLKHPTSLENQGFSSFTIAAVVDDQVILLEEVIATIRPELEARRKALPPAQYKEYERQRIAAAIHNRVQQMVILNELRKRVPDESRLDRLRSMAEADFEKYLNRIAQQNNLKTRDELLVQLKREGADVNVIKSNFIEMVLAQQFLNSMVQPKLREPTREEMEYYYQTNAAKYAEPAGVVWRQIEVKRGADPAAAQAKAEALRNELLAGADFAELAKKESQGPTAGAGGLWSRTSKGSYADPAVDQALFSIPVGEVSSVIEGKSSFHVLRVEQRSDGSPKPFTELQDEIREHLRNNQIRKVRQDVIASLSEGHHVVNSLEEQTAAQTAERDEERLVR